LSHSTASEVDAFSVEWLALLECANPDFDAGRLGKFANGTLNWSRLLNLAEDHGILPLLTLGLAVLDEGVVPTEVREKLRNASRAQTLLTLSLTAELFRVLDRFGALGIAVMLTKGPALSARCYGDPGLRQYTDIDLIVRGDDIARATEAMIALDYEARVSLKAIRVDKAPGEYVFSKSGTKLLMEFHTERTFRYHPRPLAIDKLFERRARVRFDGHEVPALSVEDELILICIHGAKHFWERLMWIADVAALVSKQSVDWERVMQAARDVQAERMLRVGLLLAMRVASAKLPAKIEDYLRSDASAARIAAKIARRLPVAHAEPFGLVGRAAFRVRMRGGILPGVAYLVRLSLSPTEEDWAEGVEDERPWLLDAVSRPFRLARKYGRDRKS
jgi:hypothetical protein